MDIFSYRRARAFACSCGALAVAVQQCAGCWIGSPDANNGAGNAPLAPIASISGPSISSSTATAGPMMVFSAPGWVAASVAVYETTLGEYHEVVPPEGPKKLQG